MDLDIKPHLAAAERTVSFFERDGETLSVVTLARTLGTTIEDVWEAVTKSDRIAHWFLPISGDLQLNGRFQLEGNAGGTIIACDPPNGFSVTWEYGGDTSWVDVNMATQGPSTCRLTLTHKAVLSPQWDQFGPGAVGVGWEGGLLGLALHMEDPDAPKIDVHDFVPSPAGQAFYVGSSKAWGEAAVAAGTDTQVAEAAAKQTAAFYTGQPPENL